MTPNKLTTNCCICGGGPAGMMLGFLLARAGIEVIVLEKHADFFRDFRGDTIHPSTIQLMHELGLLDSFLKVPHQEVQKLVAQFNGADIQVADFSHLKIAKPVLGLMPQWDFLNFLSAQAEKYSSFQLIREAAVYELIKTGNHTTGIKAKTPTGEIAIEANLVIGADGRSSDVRRLAGLQVVDTGAPIDVLWFRISKTAADPQQTFGKFEKGRVMVLLDRNDYWQCAYVIIKGDLENIKNKGLDAFQTKIADTSPFLRDRMKELQSWSDIKLLSVTIDHLQTWHAENVLCIGDAAHAMSPIGGVGINLAIQDAVAAANILYPFLLHGKAVPVSVLAKVQKRRAFPARMIQRVQVNIQNGMIQRRNNVSLQKMPFMFRLIKTFPFFSRVVARFVGMGIRPEHIQTPDVHQK
jgi:2-polyprenyl-6-methoxyphenol hydroxylase-like FAD-dependent oxidoreductase